MDSEAEIKIINEFADKGNFHAAMNIAISAVNECRRDDDQAGVDTFIGVLRSLVDMMADRFGRDTK